MGPLAGLIMIPMVAVPFLAAYAGQRINNHIGNPFRGLVFGATGWIFLCWIGGLALGYFAVLACIGLGLHGIDFTMGDFFARAKAMAEAQGGSMPAEAQGILKIQGYATLIGSPLLGVWFAAAIGCLSTFPLYGWFARRLLPNGRPATIAAVMAVSMLSVVFAGLMDNPQYADTVVWERIVMMSAQALCYIPACLWLLLRTRSVVIPALAQASVSMALAGASPIIAGEAPLLGVPVGLIPSALILLAGIGLWLWQDPGGKDLAVAGVAYDGTPLTPEMVAAAKEHEHSRAPVPEHEPGPAPEPSTTPPAP